MPSTAIIGGVITKIANKMADSSPLFNSLYFLEKANKVDSSAMDVSSIAPSFSSSTSVDRYQKLPHGTYRTIQKFTCNSNIYTSSNFLELVYTCNIKHRSHDHRLRIYRIE